MALSSHDEAALRELREKVLGAARGDLMVRKVFVPYRASSVSRDIYAHCRVLAATPTETGMEFEIEGKPHQVERILRNSQEA
jgi:hypothetical protein